MVESCSCTISTKKPLSQNCVNLQAISFEDNMKNLVCDSENGDHILRSGLKLQTSKSSKPSFQRYIDELFSSILETVDEDIMCYCIKQQEKLDCYASKISQNILLSSFSDILIALSEHYHFMSINAFAENLVLTAMLPVVDILESGILGYANNLSKDTVKFAVNCAALQIQKERIAHIFAEKFSLRIFRDFFIHIITDANRIAYHLLGSYQAVSKNQLHSFADSLIENIFKEIFPVNKLKQVASEESLSEMYALSLADDIFYSALKDINK